MLPLSLYVLGGPYLCPINPATGYEGASSALGLGAFYGENEARSISGYEMLVLLFSLDPPIAVSVEQLCSGGRALPSLSITVNGKNKVNWLANEKLLLDVKCKYNLLDNHNVYQSP